MSSLRHGAQQVVLGGSYPSSCGLIGLTCHLSLLPTLSATLSHPQEVIRNLSIHHVEFKDESDAEINKHTFTKV